VPAVLNVAVKVALAKTPSLQGESVRTRRW
jgi:hypothetical protein